MGSQRFPRSPVPQLDPQQDKDQDKRDAVCRDDGEGIGPDPVHEPERDTDRVEYEHGERDVPRLFEFPAPDHLRDIGNGREGPGDKTDECDGVHTAHSHTCWISAHLYRWAYG